MRLTFRLTLSVLITFLSVSNICAKPMDGPSPEEAVIQSDSIVVAEYLGYQNRGKEIDYFNGPCANYSIVKIIKGKKLSGIIKVKYDFQDGSACLADKNFEFTNGLMPAKRSRWILFLEGRDGLENIWLTYRGDYGRWLLNEDNLKKINNLINR